MSAPTPAGWYPDPAGTGQQRYFDGTSWTDNYAPAAGAAVSNIPPASKKSNGKTWGIIGAIALAVIVLSAAIGGGSDDADSTATEETTTATSPLSAPKPEPSTQTPPPAPPLPPPPPAGPVAPEGVVFTDSGGAVTATFDIRDAVFMRLTRFGAQSTTKEALEYALQEYPGLSQVRVIGRFPTQDAYGNDSVSDVLDVSYSRSTIDKINFDGIPNDNIWNIRDGGTVHPELLE